MRVLVCGGRDYEDRHAVYAELDVLCLATKEHGEEIVVIEGGAKGADRLARDWARAAYKGVITIEPDWRTHGRAAGPMRNARMLEHGRPDLVLAFPGGRGTTDMVARAKVAGVETNIVGGWMVVS